MKRYCDVKNIPEETDLKAGMDFRLPQYRREVFLRFYEFHTKYNAHAGAVYYAMPYLFKHFNMSLEERLWFCFLNGCCQNVCTTYEMFLEFPIYQTFNLQRFSSWFRQNYKRLGWDTDRRYVKNKMEELIEGYRKIVGDSQTEYFEKLCKEPITISGSAYRNFERVWQAVMSFPYFGRLACFSYTEYLKLAGLNLDCPTLFLDDLSGSKSHRNGICKVIGRDDYDWHEKLNPAFQGKYEPEDFSDLEREGRLLLEESRSRWQAKYGEVNPHINYYTLETTLCCYKSWHRPNRRYPNVYNDMFANRIAVHELHWGTRPLFWDMRKTLPEYLRLEDNPADVGLSPIKQNHYLETGQVIMMHREWKCFTNTYNEFVENEQRKMEDYDS